MEPFGTLTRKGLCIGHDVLGPHLDDGVVAWIGAIEFKLVELHGLHRVGGGGTTIFELQLCACPVKLSVLKPWHIPLRPLPLLIGGWGGGGIKFGGPGPDPWPWWHICTPPQFECTPPPDDPDDHIPKLPPLPPLLLSLLFPPLEAPPPEFKGKFPQ